MTRILVMGSRRRSDADFIAATLDEAADGFDDVTVVHGRCDPRTTAGKRVPWDVALAHPEFGPFVGADWIADRHALLRGWNREAHPAPWDKYGTAAGPIRNRRMVNLGAQRAEAFPLGRSVGTRGCVSMARAAGIPTTVHEGEIHV